jgi:hypothetical protein
MTAGLGRGRLPPAQRAGRTEPRAEAEGRCPGEKRHLILRPEGPRELARLVFSHTDRGAERRRRPPQEELERLAAQPRLSLAGPTVSRPFRPHRVVNLSTQGIGLRPRPWATFSRPVRPDRPAAGCRWPRGCPQFLQLHIVGHQPIRIVPKLFRDLVTHLTNAGDLLVAFIHPRRFKLIHNSYLGSVRRALLRFTIGWPELACRSARRRQNS